jgi:hypothetical protein
MAQFSPVGAYNQCTTRKANIYQFHKNSRLVSALLTVYYKKVKICARIQWTLPVGDWLNTMPQKKCGNRDFSI